MSPWKFHSIVQMMEIIFRCNRVADVRLISHPITLKIKIKTVIMGPMQFFDIELANLLT